MGLFKKFVAQTRKPEGFLGKLMVGSMNSGHSKLADWGMKHLTGIDAGTIVELGCGGGRNASELLKLYPKSSLTAIDYSEVSVQKAKDTNSDLIREGRCAVIQGNVASLPLENGSFDLATAFETVYFWPGLTACFSEVCRILKPGGIFMICNESDGTDETALRFEKIIDGMKCYTSEQLESALKAAGFSEIKTDHHPSKPWITMLAKK
ncbi:MAG: class I SAM-dependent methyltransferase [Christensenellaceae bacterium]|nr:class I SAM-dependent methyltransferase [Christensenellaceae bacterium]MBR3563436.1 class I SAM-dependent methyltransferase [Clostridia bacterium]